MAVPKRKTSISKKKMRRSHHKLSSANVIEDKKSGEYRLSHHIDLKSGFYYGNKILDNTLQLKMKSEYDFLRYLEKIKIFHKNIVRGIGDDCAVLRFNNKNYVKFDNQVSI